MPAGAMRIFGGTTKAQLMVLGVLLMVLGSIGAAMVIALPNEDPNSPKVAPAKDKYFRGVAVWAIIALLVVAVAGVVLVGVAFTGLPLIDASKGHVGIFYVTFSALLLVPSTVAARMGALLVAEASYDTAFISRFADNSYSSPAGVIALAVGLATAALAMTVLTLNARSLASVAHMARSIRGSSTMAMLTALIAIVALVVMPFMPAIEFDYKEGRVKAIGYEAFDAQDVSMPTGQVKWMGKGETRSTYGSVAGWLSITTWFLFLALVSCVAAFIGMALYSANERSPMVYQLSIMTIGAAAFGALAIVALLGLNGSIGQLAQRNDVSSAVTDISYNSGVVIAVMAGLCVALVALAAMSVLPFKAWLLSMMNGEAPSDPISMESFVDPPTGVPPSPVGWPPNWEVMTTANYAVIGVAVLVMLAGVSSGILVERAQTKEGGMVIDTGEAKLDLRTLPEGEQSFYFNDTATEQVDARPLVWLAVGVWFIESIEVTVTWTDETPLYSFKNQPDTFSVYVNTTDGDEKLQQGTNDINSGRGEIKLRMDFDMYILTTAPMGFEVPEGAVQGAINVSVGCIDAGDQKGKIGLLTLPDSGNAFSAVVTLYFKLYEPGADN
jgi:hypothetical protein